MHQTLVKLFLALVEKTFHAFPLAQNASTCTPAQEFTTLPAAQLENAYTPRHEARRTCPCQGDGMHGGREAEPHLRRQ